jgi:hypothetical protein
MLDPQTIFQTVNPEVESLINQMADYQIQAPSVPIQLNDTTSGPRLPVADCEIDDEELTITKTYLNEGNGTTPLSIIENFRSRYKGTYKFS